MQEITFHFTITVVEEVRKEVEELVEIFSFEVSESGEDATSENRFYPKLKHGDEYHGATIDLLKHRSNKIDLGEPIDEDGHSIIVTMDDKPSSGLFELDVETGVIKMSLEGLFDKAKADGSKTFNIEVTVQDEHVNPKTTYYAFTVVVPIIQDEEIGEYFASLILENFDEENEKVNPNFPYFKAIEIDSLGEVILESSTDIIGTNLETLNQAL